MTYDFGGFGVWKEVIITDNNAATKVVKKKKLCYLVGGNVVLEKLFFFMYWRFVPTYQLSRICQIAQQHEQDTQVDAFLNEVSFTRFYVGDFECTLRLWKEC